MLAGSSSRLLFWSLTLCSLFGHVFPAFARAGEPAGLGDRWPEPLPIHIEFDQQGGLSSGEVYSIVDAPFARVAEALRRPESWCDILPLHFNVKSCVHSPRNGGWLLTVYIGWKTYQRPRSAYRLPLQFAIQRSDLSRFEVRLNAEKGPLGTRNYAVGLSAVPLAPGRTLVHFRYAQQIGLPARVALFGYLHTFGRAKLGFSVSGRTSDGRPIHVRGLQGAVERNVVRYHLAVEAYLDTLDVRENVRFQRRIERWFDLTGKYREQLYEMEREEYLQTKRREHSNQLRLQEERDRTAT